MGTYFSPDVYNENSDAMSLDTAVAVGVAGLVGVAQRGPINEAVRVKSWNEFINAFATGMDSPFIANADLAYSVYGFFQNGGSECVIVRTAHSTAKVASMVSVESFTGVLSASDCGTWGNSLKVLVAANEETASNFDITVKLGDNVVEVISNLSNSASDANYWVNRVNTESAFIHAESGALSAVEAPITFSNGADGVSDITDEDYVAALKAFDAYDDISYVAIPGQTSQSVLSGIIDYCYDGSNILPVLEAPKTANTAAVKALRKTNENFTGVLVWPWGYVTDPLSKATTPNNVRMCPPAGHYMGVMSRIAQKRGVWKAPAGIEATVKGFVSCVTKVTKADTDILNPIGVVSIKAVTNYGICVWGARSLNSKDNYFKYVSDLTLDNYIKRNTYKLGLPYVFEANKENTWTSIQTVISAFMDNLMKKGAFASDKQAEAYYVKCDADLNDTHVQKNDGIIETEIGYAGSKPGEFIVFRIKHTISN